MTNDNFYRAFLSSPKAVFCPVLEWQDGVHREEEIFHLIVKAMREISQCQNGQLIPLPKVVWQYLCFLHGMHPTQITSRVDFNLVGQNRTLRECFDMVNLNMENGLSVMILAGDKPSHHPLFGPLYHGDAIFPLFGNFLILRDRKIMKSLLEEDGPGYYIVLGRLDNYEARK